MKERNEFNEWESALSSVSADAKNIKLIKRIRKLAMKPRRQMVEVNLNKLDKYAKENDNIVVPGKVLGVGSVSKKFNISAIFYSASARKKLEEAGCRIVGIDEMLKNKELKLIM